MHKSGTGNLIKHFLCSHKFSRLFVNWNFISFSEGGNCDAICHGRGVEDFDFASHYKFITPGVEGRVLDNRNPLRLSVSNFIFCECSFDFVMTFGFDWVLFPFASFDVDLIILRLPGELTTFNANLREKERSRRGKSKQSMRSLESKSYNPCNKSVKNFPRKSSQQVEKPLLLQLIKDFSFPSSSPLYGPSAVMQRVSFCVTADVNPSPTCLFATFPFNYVAPSTRVSSRSLIRNVCYVTWKQLFPFRNPWEF